MAGAPLKYILKPCGSVLSGHPSASSRCAFLSDADVAAFLAAGVAPGGGLDGAAGATTLMVRPSGATVTLGTWSLMANGPVLSIANYPANFIGQIVVLETTTTSPWDGTKVVYLLGILLGTMPHSDAFTGAMSYAPGGVLVSVDGYGNVINTMNFGFLNTSVP